ncbi:hypothetical protein JZX87_28975, partial [Agrobacterium sp. Ap1]|uniref:hypothetical protein n=1 Tax=Agrobacterium sp. Ap1 TaxID=2815337 RepID=UPI001A906A4A
WSSPVARQAHNLKAAGSNPAPATKSNHWNPKDIADDANVAVPRTIISRVSLATVQILKKKPNSSVESR